MLLFATTDVARAGYTWVMMGADAEAAARQVSLTGNQATDCTAINATTAGGNGVSISADPKSIAGDGNPASSPAPWTTPSQANTGYLYIYPATATVTPPASHCAGTSARSSGQVTAVVNFDFVPWTPFASQLFPKITLIAQATEQTQY
jgi:hypothetical protein